MASPIPDHPSPAKPMSAALGRGIPQPLAANEERFRQLVEATPAITWSTDADGVVTFANRRLFDFTGLDPANDIQDWTRLVVHPDDVPERVERWHKAKHDGGTFESELRLRRHDGTYRWFLVRVVPILDDAGSIVAWSGSATDIDERKRHEENLRFLSHASAALTEISDVDRCSSASRRSPCPSSPTGPRSACRTPPARCGAWS